MVRPLPDRARRGDRRRGHGGRALIVRRATLADADALAELRWLSSIEEEEPRLARDEFERRFRGFLADATASGRWTIFVACEGERVLATVYVQEVTRVPRPRERVGPWGYVTAVYTRSEARNAGVGARLLAHVVEWARARPLHLLLLWPSERSVPFYRRAGFIASLDAHELAFTED